ncbi:MAG: enoyl-CoA hydratase/isomerase family protein [Deltaproteobacteria bacterium]|nr:MAG: enoyl-CoA hydratase/isomerase family protein [Deltaproteobacteria bacterium]
MTAAAERQAPLAVAAGEDGVLEVALQRLPCNEIGTAMLAALEGACDAIDAAAPRVVILHSTVPAGFCAGADLRELHAGMLAVEDPAERRAAIADFLERIHRVMDRLDTFPGPVVAALHGVCFGGGFELALTADLRIAEKNTRFAFPELRLGLIPGFGGLPRLRRDAPAGLVRSLLMSGRSLGARRAAEVELVQQVVAPGEALGAARRLAAQLLRYDAHATRLGKAFVKPLPREDLDEEKRIFLELIDRPAVREALADFASRTDAHPWLPRAAPSP